MTAKAENIIIIMNEVDVTNAPPPPVSALALWHPLMRLLLTSQAPDLYEETLRLQLKAPYKVL